MAGSADSDGQASELPPPVITANTNTSQLQRRQRTLIAITACLNVLLWTSVLAGIVALYLIVVDPGDTTNIPTVALTLTSSFASIAYTILHTIFSLKQKQWVYQIPHPSLIKRNSYIAIHIARGLCVLWMLTVGWDLILVARQPSCFAKQEDLSGWQAGSPCQVGRFAVVMSVIACMASWALLFGILAIVRRPFEAHLFRYQPPSYSTLTPAIFRRQSRNASSMSEKFRGYGSDSTHRSIRSNRSTRNGNMDTVDLDSNSAPASIYSPPPVGTGLGIFTTQERPPPLPVVFLPSRSNSCISVSPQSLQPFPLWNYVLPPPRMGPFVAPSGFVPLSVQTSMPASSLRAIYPPLPSHLKASTSHSQSHLPLSHSPAPSFSYNNRHARYVVSLTRPQRLSSATPSSWAGSSPSRSTDSNAGRGSLASVDASNSTATSNGSIAQEKAYATLNATTTPHTSQKRRSKAKHTRRASAPDATAGVSRDPLRKLNGWKPQLQDQEETFECLPGKLPDGTPGINIRAFEKNLDLRLGPGKGLPPRKAPSMSPFWLEDVSQSASTTEETTNVALSMIPGNILNLKKQSWSLEGFKKKISRF
ncbi:hypothetical protein GQ43DRAFT_139706 [Delitschia confertaspora ATCC 74209]|uniref:Uncharacterized protein n=1 Tax=Delitschia confertaspora ATCC 74209 TaxID=1513339 RepID=A0A9P4JG76_9PLEO|nr:hypothetical protein GQ43DRAFT_139706 [Delitschia confertaspora ATCC 74209]